MCTYVPARTKLYAYIVRIVGVPTKQHSSLHYFQNIRTKRFEEYIKKPYGDDYVTISLRQEFKKN